MESVFVLLVLGLAASWFLATRAWARLLLAGARRVAGLESKTLSVGGLDWHYLCGGNGPLLAYYANRAVQRGPQALGQFQQVMDSGEALEDVVGQLTLPIHLQWGSADRAVNPGGAQVLLGVRPDIDLLQLEGIGHLPMLEAPRKSAEGFLQFCKERGILHCT